MHKPEFLRLIEEASEKLGISMCHFSDQWAIRLSKGRNTKYIVGYTFPLNNAASTRIARNKNVSSEVLTADGIPNVPHYPLYSPKLLVKWGRTAGSIEQINRLILQTGFPLIIKRNESSGGEGVFLVHNHAQLEKVLAELYNNDSVVCLAPFRQVLHEYRGVVLKRESILCFEKIKPCVIGDGQLTILELLNEFMRRRRGEEYPATAFDPSLLGRLDRVPQKGEQVFLQWKHNASVGMQYEIIDNRAISVLAEKAAGAIDADFVSVDIIYTNQYQFEVIEINAAVLLNSFSTASEVHYMKALNVYELALKEMFQSD